MPHEQRLLGLEQMPRGFHLSSSTSGDAGAHRLYGKATFLGRASPAVWTQIVVAANEVEASSTFAAMIDEHRIDLFDDVWKIDEPFGAESHAHGGMMSGKPAFWATFRVGRAIFRFNTFNVEVNTALHLLRGQAHLARTSSVERESQAKEDDVPLLPTGGSRNRFGLGKKPIQQECAEAHLPREVINRAASGAGMDAVPQGYRDFADLLRYGASEANLLPKSRKRADHCAMCGQKFPD